MAKKKLKMTKTCIAARRRYRAKKAGVPTGTRKAVRRKRPTGTRRRGHGKPSHYPRRRGRGRGARFPKGAGFWDDVGQTLINVGQTALQVLPLML